MKRLLITLLLAIILLVPATTAMAATSVNVTVTAVPSFVSIGNTPSNWTINGASGNGKIATAATYYARPDGQSDNSSLPNPITDNDCRFTMSNNSTIPINITVNFPNFTGGDAMANANTGSATASDFGAYAYYSGQAAPTVVAKATGSDALKSSHTALTELKWGLKISIKTGDWDTGGTMTSMVVISAVAS